MATTMQKTTRRHQSGVRRNVALSVFFCFLAVVLAIATSGGVVTGFGIAHTVRSLEKRRHSTSATSTKQTVLTARTSRHSSKHYSIHSKNADGSSSSSDIEPVEQILSSSSSSSVDSTPFQPGSFNPFQYDAKQGLSPSTATYAVSSSSSLSSANNNNSYRISLRATQMQTLNNELLNAVPFDAATLRAILESNRDFVLEPLDDDDDDNDIDDGNDNAVRRRDERVRTHLQTLEERIPIAKNNQVRQVLVAMRDFVSEHYQQ